MADIEHELKRADRRIAELLDENEALRIERRRLRKRIGNLNFSVLYQLGLPAKQMTILTALVSRMNCTPAYLVEKVWGLPADVFMLRKLYTHISLLRAALRPSGANIKCVRGQYYYINAHDAKTVFTYAGSLGHEPAKTSVVKVKPSTELEKMS